jgi:hypothetical protein
LILENRQKFILNLELKMSDCTVNEATQQVSDSTVENSGVSFEGKGLKLDTEDDGKY